MAQPSSYVEIEGFKRLESQLKQLPEKVKRTTLYRILRDVTGPVEKAVLAEVNKIERDAEAAGRQTTGNLYDAIGKIQGKSKEYVNIQVAPRAKGKFRGWHAHLVHFGTKTRKTKKGWSRGAAKENLFMERAFQKTLTQVRPDFENKIAKEIEKLAKQNILPKNF